MYVCMYIYTCIYDIYIYRHICVFTIMGTKCQFRKDSNLQNTANHGVGQNMHVFIFLCMYVCVRIYEYGYVLTKVRRHC
jgi:hypothetical protein